MFFLNNSQLDTVGIKFYTDNLLATLINLVIEIERKQFSNKINERDCIIQEGF